MPREEFNKALEELQISINEVEKTVKKMINGSIEALNTGNIDLSNKIIDMDDIVDKYKDEIEAKAIFLIASEQPVASDLRKIITIMRVIMELERMADYAEGIAKNNIRIGDEVEQSKPYGIIRFGSRVDIILPFEMKSVLKKGQKVIGGETPLI